MAEEGIVLLGCGDVGPVHEPMEVYSTLARPILAAGDIRFAQCERAYSDRGSLQIHAYHSSGRLKPHMASVFSDCGFNVVSLASNHTTDWGGDALLDTIELFQKKGIQTVGAGRNLEEARQPAIIECKGVRVAILGYCSVPLEGGVAGPKKPGIAPLRAHTYYESIEPQPGIPPRVVTAPYEEDLEGMVEDIAKAKKKAHVVVVSIHWGIHHIPRVIADYQPIAAKAAFRAGADIILGHHPHIPKAIGVYGDKVCFYSLSNFIMNFGMPAIQVQRFGITADADGSRSLIAKAVLTSEGVKKVSFLPVLIDKQFRPEVVPHGDPRFDDAVKFLDWVSEGFNHKFVVEGDEIIVTGA